MMWIRPWDRNDAAAGVRPPWWPRQYYPFLHLQLRRLDRAGPGLVLGPDGDLAGPGWQQLAADLAGQPDRPPSGLQRPGQLRPDHLPVHPLCARELHDYGGIDVKRQLQPGGSRLLGTDDMDRLLRQPHTGQHGPGQLRDRRDDDGLGHRRGVANSVGGRDRDGVRRPPRSAGHTRPRPGAAVAERPRDRRDGGPGVDGGPRQRDRHADVAAGRDSPSASGPWVSRVRARGRCRVAPRCGAR